MKRWLAASLIILALVTLAACQAKLPNLDEIRDSPFFDRRIQESDRDKCVRECKQESEHFRVDCTFCHKAPEAQVKRPDQLHFTALGAKSQVMRKSPTFGLHKQCSECHQSKFKLNKFAQGLFGPSGAKHKEMEDALQQTPVK